MTSMSSPDDISQYLRQSLSGIQPFQSCALLDYPSYPNIGDHLIWLGTLFFITDVMGATVRYAASISDFSGEAMDAHAGKAPILLQGGGNTGDLWPRHQVFREKIISKYSDRPIIILPQSIYFADLDNLRKTADIYNNHPQLTVIVRDNYSYEIGQDYFHRCKVIKAPDMAFQMASMPGLSMSVPTKPSILYLYRRDHELDRAFAPERLNLSDLGANVDIDDWVSYGWLAKAPKDWPFYIPGTVKLIREGWQRGMATPGEWFSRLQWETSHPYAQTLKAQYQLALHQKSWGLMHSGIYQLKRHRLVITNRMHAHILCVLLGIPHVLMPGSYHKNQQFYETWTRDVPFCRFVNNASDVKPAIQDLSKSIGL